MVKVSDKLFNFYNWCSKKIEGHETTCYLISVLLSFVIYLFLLLKTENHPFSGDYWYIGWLVILYVPWTLPFVIIFLFILLAYATLITEILVEFIIDKIKEKKEKKIIIRNH